jgi:hypothetical protein
VRYLSRYWRVCVTLFVATLVIHVALCVVLDPMPFSFEMKKTDLAAQKLQVDQFQPPLYPLFVRAMYGLFGPKNYRAVFAAQGIASALIAPLLFILTAHIAGPSSAYAAGVIGALYPNFTLYNLTLLESSFGVLLVTLLLLIMVLECDETHRAVAAAVTAGCGIMLMPVFLYLLPGLLVFIKKRRVFIATLFVVLLPIFIHNVKWHRKFVPIYHRWTWAVDLRKYQDEGGRVMEKLYRNATSLFRHPSITAHHDNADRSALTMKYIGYYSYLILILTGLAGLVRFYGREHRSIVIPVAVYVLLLILVGRFDLEYRVLVEPLLVVFASVIIGDHIVPALSAHHHGGVHDERRLDQNA